MPTHQTPKKTDLIGRLKKLSNNLPSNTLCLIHSGQAPCRNADTYYPFRVNSNFYYLTQLDIQNAYLLIHQSALQLNIQLFFNPPSNAQQQWEFFELPNLTPLHPLISDYQPLQQLSTYLQQTIPTLNTFYHNLSAPNPLHQNTLKSVQQYAIQTLPLSTLTGPLRLIKDSTEIHTIQQACQFSVQTHQHIKNTLQNYHFEYQIEAEFAYHLAQQNIKHLAYPSIVACGPNACTLHYQKNQSPLHSNELLLIDAGCEYQYYASDITRTWPIQTPTPEQRALYELIKETQQTIINSIEISQPISSAQQLAIRLLTKGLIKIGLLVGTVEKNIQAKTYRKFYMHGVGHHLGLDVHDPCPYQDTNNQPITFEPNMVMTIEPGLYIPNDPNIPNAFGGIGIRIEDVIHIQKNGVCNLTQALTKNWTT